MDGPGRPTEYRHEFVDRVFQMAEGGATDQEVADELEVSIRSIYRWKALYPEFRQALKVAKDVADERVIRSLYQRAIGYDQDSVKIFMPAGADKPVFAEYRERIAPDTTAAIFWLKNRQSQDWRDKRELEVSENIDNLSEDAIDARIAELQSRKA